jgi:tetratricopeptide (TPR) repeat protein
MLSFSSPAWLSARSFYSLIRFSIKRCIKAYQAVRCRPRTTQKRSWTLKAQQTIDDLGQCTNMATNRLEILLQMVERDPKNSFARYGLAMEYANSGNYEQAFAEYKALLAQDENYAAAYYHGGQALEKLGRVEEAKELYEAGLAVTKRKGDSHTHAEIEAALSLLPV